MYFLSKKGNEEENSTSLSSRHSKERENENYLSLASSNLIVASNGKNEKTGEEVENNEFNSFNLSELEILEIQMDRRVKEKKSRKGGQGSVNFELIVVPPREVAKKNIVCNSYYENEYKLVKKVLEKCSFIAMPLVEEDKENLSFSFEKANFDLSDFLMKSHELFKSDNEKEEFVFQFFYSMLQIIKRLKDERIIHGDIKPNNIVLMNNIGIESDFLAIKLIDWGFSIKCQIQKDQEKKKQTRGCSSPFYNKEYLNFKSNGEPNTFEQKEEDLYKNEFWCLGNTILVIIIKLYSIDNKKDSNIYEKLREIQNDLSKIRSKVSENLMKIIEFCRLPDILDKLKEEEQQIEELLKTRNILIKKFFHKTYGYRIKIKEVAQFIHKQSEENTKYLEILYEKEKSKFQKALCLLLSKPPSSFFIKKAMFYFIECLSDNEIEKKLNKKSKCCYHLGIELYLMLYRRKRLIQNIFFGDKETSNFYEKIFPLDFTEDNKMRFQKFISFVDENKVFEKCEKLAKLGLKFQTQFQANSSRKNIEILQARFVDFILILEEIKENFEEAFKLQTKHADFWLNLRRYSDEKKYKWIFQGDINYSISALYRIGSKIEKNMKDEEYIKEIEEFASQDNNKIDFWNLHRKIYKFHFDLIKKNEEGNNKKIADVFEYLKNIKIALESQKLLPNYMIYLLFDFLENIRRSKFKEEFLKNKKSVMKKPYFSLMELDQEPHDEFKEILDKTEKYLNTIS